MYGARIGARLVGGLMAAAMLTVFAAPAGAEHDNGYGEHPTFDRNPERGPQGTVIKLSGTGCIYRGKAWERASATFRSVAKKADGTSLFYMQSDYFPVKDDGSWEGNLVVPQDAPMGDYILRATCWASDMGLDAGEQPFTVADTPSPTSTTAAPPFTSTTTTTTTAPRPTARPSGATTTSTTSPALDATTTTTEAVPPPVSEPTDGDRETAAPTTAASEDDDGPPWGWLALVGATAAGCGAAALLTARRRRLPAAGEAGASG